jgi:hypothetical protein
MLFVLERAIKTRERSEHRPQRRAVGRNSRTPKCDGCEQSNPGSRAAVLRRSERTCLSSANDNEVGGLQSMIRSERSEQSNPGSRAAVLRRSERTCLSSANDDEVGGLQSVIRSERSEQSNTVSEWGSDRSRDRPSARRKP